MMNVNNIYGYVDNSYVSRASARQPVVELNLS